jgi:hypothetical protein
MSTPAALAFALPVMRASSLALEASIRYPGRHRVGWPIVVQWSQPRLGLSANVVAVWSSIELWRTKRCAQPQRNRAARERFTERQENA